MPDQRLIDLPAALLLATAALALSIAAGGAFLLLAVVAAGRDAVALEAPWTAAGAAAATVALLILLTRAALRPAALAVAGALAAAWPLTGVPAAVPAALAIAVVVRWGARPAALRNAYPTAALCAALALACLTAAVGPADADPGIERAAAAPVDAARGARGGGDAAPTADTAVNAGRGENGHAGAASSADTAVDAGRTPAARPDDGAAAAGGGVRAAVLGYYRALDRRAFATAWEALSPTVRASFGGFERWRDGFGATLSSRPGALAVARTGATATVTHRLVARDRAACGIAVREFSVRWQLEQAPAGWRAVALTGVPGGLIRCG